MLRFSFLLALLGSMASASAQSFRETDKSPMDMAYLPDNFAHDRKKDDKAIIRVTYSRPSRNGRELFGSKLAPYGKVWRVGANEATEIRFYQDVTLGGKPVKAGTYSLFAIPEKEAWTIVLNSDLDYWGAYSYRQEADVLRVEAVVAALKESVESFTIQFKDEGKGKAVMMLAWGTTLVSLPVTY
jgi:hypothetical protein